VTSSVGLVGVGFGVIYFKVFSFVVSSVKLEVSKIAVCTSCLLVVGEAGGLVQNKANI
jgi:hypothetical protein